ncbi:PEP-CTERM sorting domain-containing protein [Aeoliella sp. ICT_H6.2]|uniref:PEP-CTERM sorting domain-containing protein n=1 Tax=Aeoliella straminimaris TaxID=2954799 RepID=A0A9X2FIG2_9BACT|nr:PEP-CTERM sorting domain-containing protein [Aeoliella straminimaris]MCO6047121.1 PEP-CTERM sorting domain-containing protein [Aeoliella straminimaris]
MAQLAGAETLTNIAGTGGDVVVRRNNNTENDGFLRIKNQGGDGEASGNDRIGLLKFDLSGLSESITAGGVQLELPRGESTGQAVNTFDAGDILYLYGVPDLGADENFDEASVTFASFPYLTGDGSVTTVRPETDLTGNGVNDDLVPLLDTFTFSEQSDAGDLVTFTGGSLTSFLQADTNDIATFILTVSQTQDVFKTAVFVSDTGTEGTPLPPTLLTNGDVPMEGTDFNMMDGTTIDDFFILRDNYLTGTTFSQGDANLDGIVNHLDFYLWRTDYLAAGGSLSAIQWSPVPEPATSAMLAIGGVAAMFVVRKRRQRR